MAVQHAGNALNQMTFEEHDGANNAKRVTVALGGAGLTSLPTLYAVVNTSAGGGTATVTPVGLSTLAPSPNFIGIVTTVPGANVTLNASSAFIGITTIANQPALVASSAYIGLVTVGGIGTLTLADSKGFIGLTTVVPGSNVTLNASSAFIGIVTLANQPALVASGVYIGLVTVGGIGTLTLADPKGYIGLTTSTLGIGTQFIGLATVVTSGNITVLTRNAGTNKTLKIFPVTLSTASIINLVTASNTFYITSVLLNSNATVRLNIKSGATYLTGNASLGVNIFPGGGWAETGSVDSPIYFGLAGGQTITIEKADSGGIISQIGGKIVYFDE